jgi:pimeloyl-ACP methyl ester carboxylesterase
VPSGEVWQRIATPDGRALEVMVAGPADGRPLVHHGGTPVAAVAYPLLIDAAVDRGLRFVTYSRPGYATSDPCPGRSVAAAASDVATILDALDADRFVTIGWSGGGPHALACAALLPDRCLAAATVSGVAPYGVPDLDWLDGQGEENVEEFGAALHGGDELSEWLADAAEDMAQVSADDVAAVLGDLVSDVDKKALTGGYAEWWAASLRKAVSTGVAGWRDDDLAFLAPWGFDLAAIKRPVAIWQGGQDRMVPFAHGEWLAAHVSNARSHLLPEDGHLSIGLGRVGQIVDELVDLADRVA